MKRAVITTIVLALTGIAACIALAVSAGDGDAYSRGLAFDRALGWIALVALCGALAITPFARLRAHRSWPAIRRALGIAAASGALAHAAYAYFALPGIRPALWSAAQLRAGVAALLVLICLLATSFRPLLRAWKELHRLAYAACALAFLHVVLGPFAPLNAVFALFGLTLALGVLRAKASARDATVAPSTRAAPRAGSERD
ncbi:MAG TPA: hypothetical protein VHZ95_07295 [Polyangiales bacterium]|nr:hypothetical protein [Polyangiales bacterium]